MNENKKTKNTPKNYKKSLSRLMAIQIFYQFHFLDQKKPLDEIKEDVIENYLLTSESDLASYRSKIDNNFLENLIAGLNLKIATIDEEISQFLQGEWTLEKIDPVSVENLRLATLELQLFSDIPAKVIIDEYVDIAASFFNDNKVTFINATIDNLARKIRPNEFNN